LSTLNIKESWQKKCGIQVLFKKIQILFMAKIVIDEPCLDMPLLLNYEGPKPEIVYYQLKNTLKRVLGIDDKNIEEKELKWDRSSAEEKISSTFLVTKPLTETAYLFIEIKIDVTSKPSKELESEGKLSLIIDPRVRSAEEKKPLLFEIFGIGAGRIMKSEIENYKSKCKELIGLLDKDIKNLLGLRI